MCSISEKINKTLKKIKYIDILKSQCILLCLRRFINDLPNKSDERAHIAFSDERYNKQTHNNMQRWSLRRSTGKW